MDKTDFVIKSVKPLVIPKLEVEGTDGMKYVVDLSQFSSVQCFPKTQQDWEQMSITSYGFNLTWSCRFEVHFDQLVDHAISSAVVKKQA